MIKKTLTETEVKRLVKLPAKLLGKNEEYYTFSGDLQGRVLPDTMTAPCGNEVILEDVGDVVYNGETAKVSGQLKTPLVKYQNYYYLIKYSYDLIFNEEEINLPLDRITNNYIVTSSIPGNAKNFDFKWVKCDLQGNMLPVTSTKDYPSFDKLWHIHLTSSIAFDKFPDRSPKGINITQEQLTDLADDFIRGNTQFNVYVIKTRLKDVQISFRGLTYGDPEMTVEPSDSLGNYREFDLVSDPMRVSAEREIAIAGLGKLIIKFDGEYEQLNKVVIDGAEIVPNEGFQGTYSEGVGKFTCRPLIKIEDGEWTEAKTGIVVNYRILPDKIKGEAAIQVGEF